MDHEGINLCTTDYFIRRRPWECLVCFRLALIRTPTGNFHTPIIGDNLDGTVSIKYQPSEVGLHELDVFYQGQPIAGSPFKFHVDQVQTGYVTAYGPGLSHGLCNEAASFRIITKDAGSGGLSVAVEGSSKAEIQCKDNKDGTCDVTYWPVRSLVHAQPHSDSRSLRRPRLVNTRSR